MRPVDAASLIVLDGPPDDPLALMGRRSARHAFMPSVYVFPGGKVDRTDGSLGPPLLPQSDRRRMIAGLGARGTERRVRAIARAALRETEEETGYALSDDRTDGMLRYVARAITPPGKTRRFDARFLACRREALMQVSDRPTDELEDLRWVRLRALADLPLARITRVIIDEIVDRLQLDPDLSDDLPIPHHRMRNRTFVRVLD